VADQESLVKEVHAFVATAFGYSLLGRNSAAEKLHAVTGVAICRQF
jgi:hypothetical protein